MDTKTTEQTNEAAGDLTVSLRDEFAKNPLIAEIVGDKPAPQDKEEEEPVAEVEETEQPEEVETEEKPKEDGDPVDIDIDALTPEQRTELAVQLDADIKERIDTLQAEKAEFEKRAAELEAQLETGMKNFVSSNDPYPKAKNADEVKQAMKADYEWRNQLMSLITDKEPEEDDDGNAGYTIRGKFYPKSEVSKTIKEIDRDIFNAPEQLRKFEKLGEVASVQAEALAEAEGYEWFKDAKNPTRIKYDEVMQDPEVKLLGKIAPSFAAKLPAIVAAWADKSKPRKKSSMKLPLRRSGGSGSIASSASSSGSSLRDPQRDAARRKLSEGNYSPEDVVKSFFM